MSSEKPHDSSMKSCEPHKTRRYYVCSVVPLVAEQPLRCSCYMGHEKTPQLPAGICYRSYSFSVTTMEFSLWRSGNYLFFSDLSR